MNVKPTISVIVPVYNVEKYINQCIDSILNQTFADYELILIDDGSPDNCGVICDEYALKDTRVRAIHQKNGGLSAARNSGLDVMRGEYVTFVDSDDAIHPKMLKTLYEAIKQEDADISVCEYSVFDKAVPDEAVYPDNKCILLTGKDACWELYGAKKNTFVTAWSKLYKAALFENIVFPVGKIHEDNATTYKLYYLSNKVVFIPFAMYYYRFNPNGIMQTRTFDKVCNELDAYIDEISFYQERGETELQIKAQGKFEWRKTVINIEANSVKQRALIPKEYRMPLIIAIRRMYHNCEYKHFIKYLSMAYPHLSKLYTFVYSLKHRNQDI